MTNNILLIQDSASGKAVAQFALQLAGRLNQHLIKAKTKAKVKNTAPVSASNIVGEEPEGWYVTQHNDFLQVTDRDITGFDTDKLAALIRSENCGLVILESDHVIPGINLQALLNKISVPMLLIPADWTQQLPTRIAYMTDLRYCRKDILSFLVKLASPTNAGVYIAHMAAAGLPDMETSFAKDVFGAAVQKCGKYKNLFLHHINVQDPGKVADVLVNGMNNDLLVLVNHSSIFNHFIDGELRHKEPRLFHIPLLLYPN